MDTPSRTTVIFYHAHCPDGFGAAYAAWKKFGDTALYVAMSYGDTIPYDIADGNDVYFLDLCFDKPVMDQFVSITKSLTVLDHHKGVEDVVTSMPSYVFDANRSGAGIAWDHFHPNETRPSLIAFVEDDDLFRFALPETRAVITYLEVQEFNFDVWEALAQKLDNGESKKLLLAKAAAYREYFELLVEKSTERAKLVKFGEYEVYFAYSHPLKSMKSLIGNVLAKKRGPFALVVSPHPEGYGVSIRGDGSVDVSKIAEKFGGNGHPNAAGFAIPREGPFPWTLIEEKK